MIDKKTNIQYEIMTEEQKINGSYVPNISSLVAEAPNKEMAQKWTEVDDLIESTKDSTFSFDGFAFKLVCCVKRSCGHYEILQFPYNEEYDDLEAILEDFATDNHKCTRCICG